MGFHESLKKCNIVKINYILNYMCLPGKHRVGKLPNLISFLQESAEITKMSITFYKLFEGLNISVFGF